MGSIVEVSQEECVSLLHSISARLQFGETDISE